MSQRVIAVLRRVLQQMYKSATHCRSTHLFAVAKPVTNTASIIALSPQSVSCCLAAVHKALHSRSDSKTKTIFVSAASRRWVVFATISKRNLADGRKTVVFYEPSVRIPAVAGGIVQVYHTPLLIYIYILTSYHN